MSEQRLFLRKKVPLPIPIELLPGKEMWLHDIGEGGLSVSGSSRLEPGTATFFSFQFPDANSIIEASGVVAWCDGSGRVGIRFTRIKADSSAVLKRWLKNDEKQLSLEREPARPEPYRARIEGNVTILREQIAQANLDSAAALELLAETIKDHTRASGAAIALREDDSVVCQASSGNAPPPGTRLDIDRTATGECYRTGNIVSVTDTENDSRVNAALCRQLEFRSLLIVPITAGEAVLGILEVFSPLAGNFEGGDILLLGSIAELAAEIYGTRRRKDNVRGSERTEHVPLLKSTGDEEVHENVTSPEDKNDPDRFSATAATFPLASVPKEPADSSKEAQKDAPSTSANPAESLSDHPQRADEKRWKPRNYLLLMAGLTALGLGMGDLVDWRVSLRLAHSIGRPAAVTTTQAASLPAAAQTRSQTLDHGVWARSPSRSPDPATSARAAKPVSPAPEKTSVAVNRSAPGSISPPASQSSQPASVAQAPAIPFLGSIPNRDPGAAAQLTPAKLLHRVDPVVPDFARSSGSEGTVLLSAVIGTDGRLKDVKFVSGDRGLAIEAFRAVRDWRYRPYMLNGRPIEAETRIVMNFRH